jgi:hypothetical protein
MKALDAAVIMHFEVQLMITVTKKAKHSEMSHSDGLQDWGRSVTQPSWS